MSWRTKDTVGSIVICLFLFIALPIFMFGWEVCATIFCVLLVPITILYAISRNTRVWPDDYEAWHWEGDFEPQ